MAKAKDINSTALFALVSRVYHLVIGLWCMELLTKVISFPESLDEDAIATFQESVNSAIASDATVVLIDFGKVEFISSPSLMALVVAFKRVRESGKKLLLCSLNEQIKMLLELTGMDEVFEVIESAPEVEQSAELSLVAG